MVIAELITRATDITFHDTPHTTLPATTGQTGLDIFILQSGQIHSSIEKKKTICNFLTETYIYRVPSALLLILEIPGFYPDSEFLY